MSSPIRIKICGVTRPEDAYAAALAGADAIGMVFAAQSPRRVGAAVAREILAALPPYVTSIGLFMDSGAEAVREILAEVPLCALQFHGAEEPGECAAHGRPYIKTVPAAECDIEEELRRARQAHPAAQALLLDGHGPGEQGGSGRSFAWTPLPRDARSTVIVAGGLHAGNVRRALQTTGARAVDVCSGVEDAPGIKNPDKIRAFIAAVQEYSTAPSAHA